MNCQRSMNCPRCGSTMIFRKFFDYGGHSWGWECTSCKEIIDQITENRQWPKEGGNKKQESEVAICDHIQGKGKVGLHMKQGG
jgi:uncharacterized C2H2 Zn-finger protein